MEKKEWATKDLNDLLKGERDNSLDHIYLWQAHQYLCTNDTAFLFSKVKSVQIPFGQKALKGDKIEEYNYENFDMKSQHYVKQPKTGIKIVEEYDFVVGNYFGNKELKKEEQLSKIRLD